MTSPFAPAFEALLKGGVQGGSLRVEGRHIVYPVYHCCLSGDSVGVDKDPTALIKADTQEVCTGTPYCIDILGSYSATGTIVTYSVDWGDGNVSNGAWPPGGDICHPLGGWLLDYVYTVTLTVTDLLGATGTAAIEVTVLDCVEPEPPIVIGTGSSGPYYMEDVSLATVVPIDHSSLVASGSLESKCMRIYDYPDGKQSIFMVTTCGIYEYQYLPVGEGHWVYLVTQADIFAEFGLGGELYLNTLEMDMFSPGRGWCCAGLLTGTWPFQTPWALFLVTEDYWQTFSVYTVLSGTPGCYVTPSFAVSPHSDGQTIYYRTACWGAQPISRIYKSTNGGSAWTLVDSGVGDEQCVVGIPYGSPGFDDSHIYVAAHNYFRYSTNDGSSWNSGPSLGRAVDMQNPWQRYDVIDVVSYTGLSEWSISGGLTTLYSFAPSLTGRAMLVLARNANWSAIDVIVGADTLLFRWISGFGTVNIYADIAAQTGNDGISCLAHKSTAGTEWP